MTPRTEGSFGVEYSALAKEYAQLRSAAASKRHPWASLLTDGIQVINDFMTTSDITSMRESLPAIDTCMLSPEGTQTRFKLNADSIPALAPFFSNNYIRDAMESALGSTATMHRATVQYRTVVGNTGAFEHFFHIDTWRPRYKAFLYMVDVDELNGPFVYTPRTHYGAWRKRMDEEIFNVFRAGPDTLIHDEDSAYVGCYWPHQHKSICEMLNTRPVVQPEGRVPSSYSTPAGCTR